MTEYWSQPAKTGEAIRDGWLYSGDIVRADEDSYLYYFDRKKYMIRRAGENTAPREVDNVVDELKGVEGSAAIPVSNEMYGEVVKLLVVRVANELTEEDVTMRVACELAAYNCKPLQCNR